MHHPLLDYVLAFDLSLDRLDVGLQAPDGDWLIPHQAFDNNWPGFQHLKQEVLAHLSGLDQVQLTAVGESSALYWWHIFYQLATDPDFAPLDPHLALLNPAHVKNFRKALPQEDKSDPQDTQLVCRYYRNVGVKDFYRFDPRYLPLRQLSRAYCRLIHSLASEKAFCCTLIYLSASEYQRIKPFSDTFGVTSSFVLSEYPDVAALADIPLDELVSWLNARSRGTLKDPNENTRKLHRVAQDSYPLPDFLAPTVHTVLHATLDHIRFLEHQKAVYTRLIKDELAQLPEADLALAQSGLGPILVAGCLSEIQDPRRFTTGRKYDRRRKRMRDRTYRDGQAAVARMAGLWWPGNSSGRFQGEDRPLARERNPYLRYWFVQAAYCLKRHQDDFATYYQRKFNESRKHKHKRALILTARKAVRPIFALLHKGQLARLEELHAT
jgi:transposase